MSVKQAIETEQTTVSSPIPLAQETVSSSLPIGDEFAKRTKGLQPRSRYATTREAYLRPTAEGVDYFSRLFQRESIAKTHISEDDIPEGVTTLWARQYFKGMPDSTNLRELERKGWQFGTPDMFPTLSFTDDTGDIRDDAGRVINNEFYLMYRPLWIHDLELKKNQRDLERKDPFEAASRDSRFDKAQPFVRYEGTESQHSRNYASSQKSNEFLNEFSKG